jgi:hypothetical protein
MWFRVFGTSAAAPEPAALLEHLRGLGVNVEGHFKGDDLGWFGVDFIMSGNPEPFHLDRYLAEEDDIRDDLNAWAAWLESVEDPAQSVRLMQLMIGSNQMFTMEIPRHRAEEAEVDRFCVILCRYLAAKTAGAYQVDGQGFFDANGKLLVKE